MTQATPQRTVNIFMTGRIEDDAEIAYTYWSPSDGITGVEVRFDPHESNVPD